MSLGGLMLPITISAVEAMSLSSCFRPSDPFEQKGGLGTLTARYHSRRHL